MRCLTLADALREKGAEVTFVCREHHGHLFELIESSGHQLLRLPLVTSSIEGRLAHAYWLDASQEEDARQTAEALKTIGRADWLIIDHYALDVEWETAMRSCAKRIMVIDDLADRVHDCDVLLDQNLHLADMETRYERLVPARCKKLLGPKYALLRPEFREARSKLKMRDGSVKRIFVFFGGSDPTNETGKTLRAIQQLDRTDIAIDVIVGSTNPHQMDIADLCMQLPKATLYRQVNNMAELMAKADLAIGAGGGAMWERCSLGLPTIVVSVADNQQSGCEAAARQGAILYLGGSVRVGVEVFEAALRVATSSPAFLKSMSEKCEALVDGQGVKRIARQLIAPAIILRRATLADCESIFNWRNAEETRQFSSTTSRVSIEEHRVWFGKTLENPDRQLLIGEFDQQAVGVLRFDRDEKCAAISVYLVPGNYGRGIGGRLIEQGNAWVKQHWPEVTAIQAVIMDGNAASIAAFLESGFKRYSYTYVKQIGN